MNERLLQYIWQFQYYQQQQLQTTHGEPLLVLHPGSINKDQGPDFSAAKIKIGQTVWAGNIELHVKTSDWDKHKHSDDGNYKNVILHVVWEDDASEPADIPVLVLENRVSSLLLNRYHTMMHTIETVACHHYLPAVSELVWCSWKERMAVERLERKSGQIIQQLQQNQYHWDEVFWWQLAAGFGSKVNAAFFEQMAKTIPLSVVARHRIHLDELEALLFGQSHLLHPKLKDSYGKNLYRIYQHLQKKYILVKAAGNPAFLRMRPASFPTIRIAQLAMLLHLREHLFDLIRSTATIQELSNLFHVKAGLYWNTHYCFDDVVAAEPRFIGKQMILHIMVNTVIPVLFAYGHEKANTMYKDKALYWLYQLEPEQNKITRYWKLAGVANRCALDTQALIELHTQYCVNKRCLDCSIGNKLLRG